MYYGLDILRLRLIDGGWYRCGYAMHIIAKIMAWRVSSSSSSMLAGIAADDVNCIDASDVEIPSPRSFHDERAGAESRVEKIIDCPTR